MVWGVAVTYKSCGHVEHIGKRFPLINNEVIKSSILLLVKGVLKVT